MTNRGCLPGIARLQPRRTGRSGEAGGESRSHRRKKTGILEGWKIGMVGVRDLTHYSIIPHRTQFDATSVLLPTVLPGDDWER